MDKNEHKLGRKTRNLRTIKLLYAEGKTIRVIALSLHVLSLTAAVLSIFNFFGLLTSVTAALPGRAIMIDISMLGVAFAILGFIFDIRQPLKQKHLGMIAMPLNFGCIIYFIWYALFGASNV